MRSGGTEQLIRLQIGVLWLPSTRIDDEPFLGPEQCRLSFADAGLHANWQLAVFRDQFGCAAESESPVGHCVIGRLTWQSDRDQNGCRRLIVLCSGNHEQSARREIRRPHIASDEPEEYAELSRREAVGRIATHGSLLRRRRGNRPSRMTIGAQPRPIELKVDAHIGDNKTGGNYRHRRHRDCECGENNVRKTGGETGNDLGPWRDGCGEQRS